MIKEADITIEGVRLTLAQSMTVRVAVSSYMMDMRMDGLGDDETGKAIAAGYIARGNEVLELIHKELNSE
jgi:hypothetical protein